jgi:hypothetical protein
MSYCVLVRTDLHAGKKSSYYVWDEAKANELALKYGGQVLGTFDTEEEAEAHMRWCIDEARRGGYGAE